MQALIGLLLLLTFFGISYILYKIYVVGVDLIGNIIDIISKYNPLNVITGKSLLIEIENTIDDLRNIIHKNSDDLSYSELINIVSYIEYVFNHLINTNSSKAELNRFNKLTITPVKKMINEYFSIKSSLATKTDPLLIEYKKLITITSETFSTKKQELIEDKREVLALELDIMKRIMLKK